MPRFQESDLTFDFPASWRVRAFDNHRFYQAISGQGLKAVDFVILHPDGKLWLMEVKNYQPRQDEAGAPYPLTLPTPQELADQLGQKLVDSRRILRIIDRYYQRKWYYRWRLSWSAWWPFPKPDSDLLFWNEAAVRLAQEQDVPILFLQLEAQDLYFRRSITSRLSDGGERWEVMEEGF